MCILIDGKLFLRTLEREIKSCNTLIIWTDCDREGENIGFEIITVCKAVKSNIKIFRAKFSEITAQSARRAMETLGQPNKRVSDAVDVRSELDLRIGAAFTRFQTLRLQQVFPTLLSNSVISYGSCQFPTLGFVVERYKAIERFVPEKFWKIKVLHVVNDLTVEFVWKRVRLFDQLMCQVLFERCLEDMTATVEKITSKPKSKWRPLPLDTVELEKISSRKLKINAKETMAIAEKLYTKGLISYPRTETNIFPKELNLRNLVEMHTSSPNWGDFASRILNNGPNPRQGKKSDQAHPPIHPTKYVDNLSGNEAKIYEYVVRHFLACLSKDAVGHETIVDIDINNEKFVANGLMILEKNYLEVYPYEKWNSKEIHIYQQGQIFRPTSLDIVDGETSPPKLLTEADLIALMEKHGIGTDATHAEHIDKIKFRRYVGLEDGIHFVPGHLGIGLVDGYDNMGFPMSKPNLRAELEADLVRICNGEKQPELVLAEQIAKYKEVFRIAQEQADKLDEALSKYMNAQPEVLPIDQRTVQESLTVMKCVGCNSDINVKTRPNSGGYFLGCMGYPECKMAIWFPTNVLEVEVTTNTCTVCGPGIRLLKFKFRPGSMNPYYPNTYIGCVNGCDEDLLELMDIQPFSARLRNRVQSQTAPPARLPSQNSSVSSGYASMNGGSSVRSDDWPSMDVFQNSTNNMPRSNERNQRPRNHNNQNLDGDSLVCCTCGEPARRLTVMKESVNKGRQFYSCHKGMGGCSFFQWADDDDGGNGGGGRGDGPGGGRGGGGKGRGGGGNGLKTQQFKGKGWGDGPTQSKKGVTKKRPASSQGSSRKCSKCFMTGHTRNRCPEL
uniref:DNA topoisomerase n=1 Tax=Clastoptera arizonana TaxID=38151 RepID=A0A1B6CJT6_9HEMI